MTRTMLAQLKPGVSYVQKINKTLGKIYKSLLPQLLITVLIVAGNMVQYIVTLIIFQV